MWVVIGVGSLIVVVLMVFVIHLYKRIQHKKVRGPSSQDALRVQISSGDYRDLSWGKKKKKKEFEIFFSALEKMEENGEQPPAADVQTVLPV